MPANTKTIVPYTECASPLYQSRKSWGSEGDFYSLHTVSVIVHVAFHRFLICGMDRYKKKKDNSQRALSSLMGLWISGDYWSAPLSISSSPQWPTYAWFPRWLRGAGDTYGRTVTATLTKTCRVSKNPPAVIMALFSQHMTTTHGPEEFPEDSAQRLCSLFPESHVWLIAFFFVFFCDVSHGILIFSGSRAFNKYCKQVIISYSDSQRSCIFCQDTMSVWKKWWQSQGLTVTLTEWACCSFCHTLSPHNTFIPHQEFPLKLLLCPQQTEHDCIYLRALGNNHKLVVLFLLFLAMSKFGTNITNDVVIYDCCFTTIQGSTLQKHPA